MTAPTRIPAGLLASEMEQLRATVHAGRFPWWYPEAAKGRTIQYAVLSTSFLPLGASANVTNPINIPGSWAFLVLASAMVVTATDNVTFLLQRPILVQLEDTGSQETLANEPVHADNWFGTAELPMLWPVPRVLVPNQTFRVTCINQEAVARNVRVAFHGIKVYAYPVR